jgi:tRNA pseudouridine13 synthase
MEELSKGNDRKEYHVIEATEDKEERTAVHEAIKKLYPKLTSTTSTEDGKRVIKVMLSKFAGEKQNRKNKWPKGRGDYCKFVLYKENRDTMEAVSVIARLLCLGPRSFHYAGTKDKRGITSQSVTVFRTKASRLAQLNKTLNNIRIGNFSYVSDPLKLGDLKGNRFTVVLREVGGEEDEVSSALCSLRDKGFVNYFGMQRFGTSVIPTHEIGKSLLLCDWQKALDLVLMPRVGEAEDITAARKLWAETRDPQKAWDIFPKRRNVERCALNGIILHGPTNPLAAILKIPRNTRLMYVHSYQSYVWNKVVSQRVAEHGMRLMIGDLVKKTSVEGAVKDSSEVDYITSDNVGSFSIHDLLLPLPGFDVLYPKNEVAEWYKTIMAKDGIDSSHLNCKVKDFALPGGYRCVFVKPKDLSWSMRRYTDYTQSLVCSDLEELEGGQIPQGEGDENRDGDPPHSAVILRFTLPPSSYATIAVREVIKMNTSVAHQTSLNAATRKQDGT